MTRQKQNNSIPQYNNRYHHHQHQQNNVQQQPHKKNDKCHIDYQCNHNNVDIRAHLLRWSVGDYFGDLYKILMDCNYCNDSRDENDGKDNGDCNDINSNDTYHDNNKKRIKKNIEQKKKFDIIIAADCLFFKDFHKDFLWILKESSVEKGYVFLLQPKRSNTLDLFINEIKLSLLFDLIYIKDDYNDEINYMRKVYQNDINMKNSNVYDEDIHYPILICLQVR